jgi:gas vesicle protein
MANQDQGSFLTGFTVGLFAGAAGFFFFGTDQGRRVKTQLAREWQLARNTLPERGSGMINYDSVSDIIRSVGTAILSSEKEGRDKVQAQANQRSKRTAAVKKTTAKFKGV